MYMHGNRVTHTETTVANSLTSTHTTANSLMCICMSTHAHHIGGNRQAVEKEHKNDLFFSSLR